MLQKGLCKVYVINILQLLLFYFNFTIVDILIEYVYSKILFSFNVVFFSIIIEIFLVDKYD